MLQTINSRERSLQPPKPVMTQTTSLPVEERVRLLDTFLNTRDFQSSIDAMHEMNALQPGTYSRHTIDHEQEMQNTRNQFIKEHRAWYIMSRDKPEDYQFGHYLDKHTAAGNEMYSKKLQVFMTYRAIAPSTNLFYHNLPEQYKSLTPKTQ